MPGLRVALVAARWHEEVTAGLLEGALRAVHQVDAVGQMQLLDVAGCFELPAAAVRLARGGYQAVICLGAVIRGGTPHFDHICQATLAGLMQVSVLTGVPVGMGVLTCDTLEQALERCGLGDSQEDKGYEAARAALELAHQLKELGR